MPSASRIRRRRVIIAADAAKCPAFAAPVGGDFDAITGRALAETLHAFDRNEARKEEIRPAELGERRNATFNMSDQVQFWGAKALEEVIDAMADHAEHQGIRGVLVEGRIVLLIEEGCFDRHSNNLVVAFPVGAIVDFREGGGA